ncbi:hypothetical protein [uncultured Parolsenella sp.]|uniref:hypothetical protein n=1 Tax=uncultured Parolsenella sp. TaxID=2083008 RepID=UPI0027D9885F|nr:hypothetical protein [uncultured Parolsenella sp.]
MRKTVFSIQPKDGGAVETFDANISSELSAKYQLMRDAGFKRLEEVDRTAVVTLGKCLLSAVAHGVALDADAPTPLTVAAVTSFADRYAVDLAVVDIPEGDAGAPANPTAGSGLSS